MKSLGEQLFDSYDKNNSEWGRKRKDRRRECSTYPRKKWVEMNKPERDHWEQIASNPQFVNRFD